jgi:hypothetical protein
MHILRTVLEWFLGNPTHTKLCDAFVPSGRSPGANQYLRALNAVRDGSQQRWERQALRVLGIQPKPPGVGFVISFYPRVSLNQRWTSRQQIGVDRRRGFGLRRFNHLRR